jgi:hypothetical protein
LYNSVGSFFACLISADRHNQHKGGGEHQRQHVMVVAPADEVAHDINFTSEISPADLRPCACFANQTMAAW